MSANPTVRQANSTAATHGVAATLADLPTLPAIVDGLVSHRRATPFATAFEHRAYLWLVDVDDLPEHGILARFDAADHLGAPNATLRENVETFVAAQGVEDELPRIVMLAAARVAGYVFDPLSVFWCFGADGRLVCVVAEVHNTYGERDAYLLRLDADGSTSTDKRFYVSPFFDVSGRYVMTFSLTSTSLAVRIELQHDVADVPGDGAHGDAGDASARTVFTATFSGTPRPATRALVRATSWRQPLMPQRVSALIRMHGIALWARRLPIVARPEHSPAAGVQPADDATVCDATASEAPASAATVEPWKRVGAAPSAPRRSRIARRLIDTAARRAGVDVRIVDELSERDHTPAPWHERACSHGAGASQRAISARTLQIELTPAAVARLAVSPKIGLAEGYIAGEWDAAPGTDLAAALTPFAARFTDVLPAWAWRLRRLTDAALPEDTRNTRGGSKRNIEAHYDLSNELFAAFLDETLSYSSALFDDADPAEAGVAQAGQARASIARAGMDQADGTQAGTTESNDPLADAQRRKLDAVLDLAGATAGARVLEIGSGWGSLAVRAAERGAHVVSITLSHDQLAVARRRAAEAGFDGVEADDATAPVGESRSGSVEFRLQDYRDVTGQFDCIVSVEMIEAVGEEFWDDYVRVLHDRLRPGGRAAIQAITMSDERMLATRHSHGWVQEYIFPGGLIPSVAALQRSAARHGVTLTSARSFGIDYARTLHAWRERFEGNWPQIAALGFDERFHRMWRLYLAYCEAGFAAGYLDVEHLLLERPAR